jgi:thioester reductase-like protein
VQLSESAIRERSNYRGVPEDDDLEGAKSLLKTGYGQTKWVSEKLLFEAGKRGLNGHILRPGYVVGDSKTAGEKCTFSFHQTMRLNTLIHFSNQHGRFYLALGQGMHTVRLSSRH